MLTSDNLERTRKNWISSPKAAGIFRDSEVSACDSHVVAHQCSRTVGTCSIVCFIAPKAGVSLAWPPPAGAEWLLPVMPESEQ